MNKPPEPITFKLDRESLSALALSLDTVLNNLNLQKQPSIIEINPKPPKRENGFVLMVFPFNDRDGQCHYVSNGASREDIIRLFTEQLRQLDAQKEAVSEQIRNLENQQE